MATVCLGSFIETYLIHFFNICLFQGSNKLGRRASTIKAEQRNRPRHPDGSFSSLIDSVRNDAPSCFSRRGTAA